MNDPSKDPEIRRLLGEVIRLSARDKGVGETLAHVRADMGVRFAKIRDRLYLIQKKRKGWEKWVLANTDYDPDTVDNYTLLAELRKKTGKYFPEFFRRVPCSKLYRLAVTTPEILATLTPDSALLVPGMGELPIVRMTYNQLNAALDALEGKKPSAAKPPKTPDPCEPWLHAVAKARDRNEYADLVVSAIRAFVDWVDDIRDYPGRLVDGKKRAVLDAWGDVGRIFAGFPAFATQTPKEEKPRRRGPVRP